ncbi:hypothetical protein [Alkalicoccus daliensis]|uniref:Uncharacterized protein n=1 Tax=Alkalicoccus daliensis TaxID=745820 RepID=A0A1H0AB66_9BACI|nr:hypothetical protein [Alkalicoccus daliensis]SDN30667.1 hypothetical protein SAMN04488053_101418 [Alkalicoccus daliensis]
MTKYVEYLIGEEKEGAIVPKDNIIHSIELDIQGDKGEDKDYIAGAIAKEIGIPLEKVLVGTIY